MSLQGFPNSSAFLAAQLSTSCALALPSSDKVVTAVVHWRYIVSFPVFSRRPRGPMDKASAYGAGDCRFESYRGHLGLHCGWGSCCPTAVHVSNSMTGWRC